MIIGFVPARGGSTRVPGKNLREVGGLTLLDRAIRCARNADLDRIVVSTDDPAIARAVQWWIDRDVRSVELHDRPAELAGPEAQIEPSIAAWLEGQTGIEDTDIIVLLQPTSPFRRPETIKVCVDGVRRTALPCATVRLDAHSSFFAADITGADGAGNPIIWWRRDVAERPRSQDLDGIAVEDGCVYAFTVGHFREHGQRLAPGMTAVPIDRWESLEIDTEDDLQIANELYLILDWRKSR